MTGREELREAFSKIVIEADRDWNGNVAGYRKYLVDRLTDCGLFNLSAPASGSVDREAIARVIDPSAWRDEGYSWATWRIEQSLKKADAILALLPAQAVHPDVSALRRALETCRDFIRGEQIENAVVCIGSMQSLGDMIDEALAATSSREVSEEELARDIWLAGFRRAFDRAPTDPWENQGDSVQAPHRDTARALLSRCHVLKKEVV